MGRARRCNRRRPIHRGAVDARRGDEPVIDLSEELEDLSDESDAERFDGEPVGVYTISAGADDAEFDALDLMPADPGTAGADDAGDEPRSIRPPRPPRSRRRPAVVEPLFTDEMFVRVAVHRRGADAIGAGETGLLRGAARSKRPNRRARTSSRWAPMYLTPGRIWPALEGVPAEMPAARTEQPDWIELVASLRQDLERRRTDPAAAAPTGRRAAVRRRERDNPLRLVKKPRPARPAQKTKPLQDEWGFFDPERCGFSTLLAKLEEITEEDART